jgi:hypothetical protein
MASVCFIQFHSIDGSKVEAAATIYSNDKELPPGQWSVMRSNSNIDEIMLQEDMPEHWQKELQRWNGWFEKNMSDTMD